MRRLLAILLIAPLTGCGAHLHRPIDDQLAQGAAAKVDALDWDEAFSRDRAQRDATAQREAELGRAHANARREAELLDVLTEPVGEASWTKFEARFVALAACMLDAPGTSGGRACRGASDAELAVARALLFDACPADGCVWVDAIKQLSVASGRLAEELALYDRARGDAGLDHGVATLAQCPVPIRVPAALRDRGARLEQACAAYDHALVAVAAALPESSKLRKTIAEAQSLLTSRDGYRRELRLLVAELSSVRFESRFDVGELDEQVGRYLALQSKYGFELASARLGDFGDLALEGILLVTREHRAALLRSLARGVRAAAAGPASTNGEADESATESFRADGSDDDPTPGTPTPDPAEPPDPDPDPSEPPRPEPEPPRPVPDPVPPRPIPEPPDTNDDSPDPPAGASEREVSVDVELLRSLGASLVPVFGATWRTLHEQGREAKRGSLLLSAEIERIQIDAMTRRLAYAEDRVWLELGAIEIQLLALARLRVGLDADWIPAVRPATPEQAELERLRLELELAEATLVRSKKALGEAVDKLTSKPGKTASSSVDLVAAAKQRVRTAQAAVDAAADAFHRHIQTHKAALCLRQGSVSQTYERDPACVDPIEDLVGLHAQVVGVAVPRLEALERSVARREDEAILLRDQAALEIRITYIAASIAALQRFTAGGLEGRDIAAIVGSVVGIGLGAAITAGVYIP